MPWRRCARCWGCSVWTRFGSPWAERESTGGDLHDVVDALVTAQLAARQQARADKDFATADAIRDSLTAAGIVIEDTADGARWSLARGALMAGNSQRKGAIRKGKKGPTVGSGGQRRKQLKGRGPTPKASRARQARGRASGAVGRQELSGQQDARPSVRTRQAASQGWTGVRRRAQRRRRVADRADPRDGAVRRRADRQRRAGPSGRRPGQRAVAAGARGAAHRARPAR